MQAITDHEVMKSLLITSLVNAILKRLKNVLSLWIKATL